MDPILDVATRKGIPVIEDACQSLGAAYQGRKAGALGTFGCFSFFPSKNLGGFGDGGMVTTDDDGMAATLRAMRMHGETSRYHHRFVGGNFRLDALQAAILHVKLPHLDGWAEGRRRNAREIEALYAEFGGLPFAKGGLAFPREAPDRFHVYNQFVARVGNGKARGAQAAARRATDRPRGLLPGLAARAGVLRLSRPRQGSVSGIGEGGGRVDRPSRLSGALRRPEALSRLHARRIFARVISFKINQLQ